MLYEKIIDFIKYLPLGIYKFGTSIEYSSSFIKSF